MFNPHLKEDFSVLVCTDNKEIESQVKLLSEKLNFELHEGKCESDLIAMSYNLGIIDPKYIEDSFLWFLNETRQCENPKEFSILLTQKGVTINKRLQKYFVEPKANSLDLKLLKFIILNKRSAINQKHNNKKSYDKRIFRLLYILRKLQPTNSYLTINELCKEFNVSERTIRRDIKLLGYCGEFISYDHYKKAYFLEASIAGLNGI